MFGILRVATVLIPWIIVMYLSIKFGILLKALRKQRRSSERSNQPQNTDSTSVLLTLCITLCVCYMPSVIQGIVYWAHPDQPASCGHLHYYLDNFCKMFKVLNSCLILLILCLFQPSFSKCVRNTFWSNLKCCRKEVARERNVRFKDYKCEDTSEMTLMSLIRN